jgi:hypothetical protein
LYLQHTIATSIPSLRIPAAEHETKLSDQKVNFLCIREEIEMQDIWNFIPVCVMVIQPPGIPPQFARLWEAGPTTTVSPIIDEILES